AELCNGGLTHVGWAKRAVCGPSAWAKSITRFAHPESSRQTILPTLPVTYELALQCNRAEAREDVAAVGRKEIPVGVIDHAAAGCPGAAAQHLAAAEPGSGIVLIDVG